MSKLIGIAVMAAASALAFAALPASGQDTQPTRTLKLTGKPRPADLKMIDVRPHGESVGDRMVQSETLRQGKAPAARVESDCLLVDRTYEGAQCNFTLIFDDGTIIAEGASVSKRIPGIGGTDEDFAILGGTGAYDGASGSVALRSTGTRDNVTIRVRP